MIADHSRDVIASIRNYPSILISIFFLRDDPELTVGNKSQTQDKNNTKRAFKNQNLFLDNKEILQEEYQVIIRAPWHNLFVLRRKSDGLIISYIHVI